MALEFTEENFESTALKSDKLVMVDFWAEWCGPCRMVGPHVEELSKEYEGKAVVGKVNVDLHGGIAAQFGVRNIPTIVFLKNGELVEAEEYMDYGSEESYPAIFGDVIYKIQIGIFGQNDLVNIEKYEDMKGIEITEMNNGLLRYTTGTFTNIQAAMIRMNELKSNGHDNCYVISFYNEQQISLKKAQELTK